jgi:hypothetical protein
MRWFRIRKASIPEQSRQMFERFGPSVISAVLYAGFDGPNTTEPRKTLYENASSRTHAAEWLTEQYDRAERKETWSITMEVAITVFVAAELFSSIAARLNPTDGPPKTNRSSGGQPPGPTNRSSSGQPLGSITSTRPSDLTNDDEAAIIRAASQAIMQAHPGTELRKNEQARIDNSIEPNAYDVWLPVYKPSAQGDQWPDGLTIFDGPARCTVRRTDGKWVGEVVSFPKVKMKVNGPAREVK